MDVIHVQQGSLLQRLQQAGNGIARSDQFSLVEGDDCHLGSATVGRRRDKLALVQLIEQCAHRGLAVGARAAFEPLQLTRTLFAHACSLGGEVTAELIAVVAQLLVYRCAAPLALAVQVGRTAGHQINLPHLENRNLASYHHRRYSL